MSNGSVGRGSPDRPIPTSPSLHDTSDLHSALLARKFMEAELMPTAGLVVVSVRCRVDQLEPQLNTVSVAPISIAAVVSGGCLVRMTPCQCSYSSILPYLRMNDSMRMTSASDLSAG